MDCQIAQRLIAPSIDSETSPEETAQLAAHLDGCETCRTLAEQQRAQDEQLRAAFAPARELASQVAMRVAGQLPAAAADLASRAESQIPAPVSASPIARSSPWPGWFLAAAAGFLLAVAIFRPWEKPGPSPSPRPVAHLALATGPIEVLPPGSKTWTPRVADASLEFGCRMRTDENRLCEVVTREGSQLLLNTNTEVALPPDRKIELALGRLFVRCPGTAEPLEIETPQVAVKIREATLDISASPQQTELIVLEGAATVAAANWQHTVAAGRAVRIADGRIAKEYAVDDPITATRWIHEILLQKGEPNPELTQRVNRLWAEVGRAKLAHLYEAEIRSLGDSCVAPLSAYVTSPESQAEPDRRVVAARILSDVAQPRSIPRLIELLLDRSGDVRYHAAQALERLTGQNFGRPADQWRADSWTACQPTHQAWQNWQKKRNDER